MRTEQEIEAVINNLSAYRYPPGIFVQYSAEKAIESCIAWLQWVLGKREEPYSYICSVHKIVHPQVTCPACEQERRDSLSVG